MLDLVFEGVATRQKHDRDQTRPEVLAELRHDLVARRVAQHQVEKDDVGPPLHSGFMGGGSVVDGDALETRALEHALDEPEHLVVVVDDKRDVAVHQSGTCAVRRRGDCHAACPLGSFSVSAIARSAAARTSWISALIASGSLASSAISSL